ncbi:MAG: 7-cyano-7-deazaguanine synthase [Vicinamibacterales bacterium]
MPTAVLFSAGLDSAVLAAAEARNGGVHAVYVSCGLAWEAEELEATSRLLDGPAFGGVESLTRLTFDARDLYPATHWALTGQPPAFDTPDEDVYLTGRNIMLLSKAAIYCAQHDLHRVVLATLAHNPFPDATAEFFGAMSRALSLGLNHTIEIGTPFATMEKSDVVRLGVELGVPLELTLSCMNPRPGRHCGLCSKCRERRDAFLGAGVDDRTEYATAPIR